MPTIIWEESGRTFVLPDRIVLTDTPSFLEHCKGIAMDVQLGIEGNTDRFEFLVDGVRIEFLYPGEMIWCKWLEAEKFARLKAFV